MEFKKKNLLINRWFIISILAILILCLIYYGTRTRPWKSFDECLRNPEKFHGHILTHFQEPKIGRIYSDGFDMVQKIVPSIRVYTDQADLIPGKSIQIKAAFHKKGYLIAQEIKMAKNRSYKIWLSVIPVLGIGIYFLRIFRINFRKFEIELR